MAIYEGHVSGSQQRWELGQDGQVLVWDFRVERADTEGSPLPRIPVQMRAQQYDGGITEGDWVQVEGTWSEGRTLYVEKVINLTTGAHVRALRQQTTVSAGRRVAGTILALLFMFFFIWLIFGTH